MKKKVVKLIENRISRLYKEARELLLSQKSYDTKRINTQSVMLYLAFLESSLKKPYNRLNSLSAFINEDGSLLTDQMYPFAMLYEDTKEVIKNKTREAARLAEGLDVSEIDPDYQSLCIEKHIRA